MVAPTGKAAVVPTISPKFQPVIELK